MSRAGMRLGYAATEVGGQLVFALVSFYLLKFYTDVFGLPAAVAGTVLLTARGIDAVDTPVWGVIFDRTQSRWGRSRPWFLRLCVPFALAGFLTFFTPGLSPGAKAVYAAVTYVTCSVLYTGINTPVTSILSDLRADAHERVVLTSWRMFGSKGGTLLVNLCAMKLVAVLGAGDDRRGYARTVALFAVASVVLFLFAFSQLKEREDGAAPRLAPTAGLRALRANPPWTLLFLSNFAFWIAFIARIASAPYLFEYVLGRPGLTGVANALDATSLATILALPWLSRRWSKRTLWAASLVATVIAQALLAAAVAAHSVPGVMAAWALGFLASGIAMALPFTMIADTVDYGEWRSGLRAPGILTAVGTAFCIKAGAGLGAAIPAWILQGTGYVANAIQSATALRGIQLGAIWMPAAFFALATIPVLFYGPYERLEPQIRQALEWRRRPRRLP